MTPAERARRALPCLTWDEGPTCEGRFGEDTDLADHADRKWRWCENCRARVPVEREIAEAEEVRDAAWDVKWDAHCARHEREKQEAIDAERARVLRLFDQQVVQHHKCEVRRPGITCDACLMASVRAAIEDGREEL